MCSLLGLQDATDAIIVALQAIEHEAISKQAQILVDMCAYAGTGNVLKVQTLLHHCDEHIVKKEKEEKKEDESGEETKEEQPQKDDTFQAFAVLGIALVAMGEEIGSEMSLRQLNHLVRVIETCVAPPILQLTYSRSDAIWRANHPEICSSSTGSAQRIKSSATHTRYAFEI